MGREVSKCCYIPGLSPTSQPQCTAAANVLSERRFLVFHGGSGSTKDEIKEAVNNGVVKMNVDTDTQVRAPSLSLRSRVRENRGVV